MKNHLILVLAFLSVISCTKKQDPTISAIQSYILEQYPDMETMAIDNIALSDSSTFEQEFMRRSKLFALRMRQDEALYKKFLEERKPKNAQMRYDNLVQDIRIKNGLDSLKQSMGESVNDIAFYIYEFTGKADAPTKSIQFNGSFAALTPDNEVICVAHKKADVMKVTGRVIPGYRQLLKDDPFEEELVGE